MRQQANILLKDPVDYQTASTGDTIFISTLGMSPGTVVQALYSILEPETDGKETGRVDWVDQIVTGVSAPSAWPDEDRIQTILETGEEYSIQSAKQIAKLLDQAQSFGLLEPDSEPKTLIKDVTDSNCTSVRDALLTHVERRRNEIGPDGRIIFDFTGGRVGMSYYLGFAAQLLGEANDQLLYTNVNRGKGDYLLSTPGPRQGETPRSRPETTWIPKGRDHIFRVPFPLARIPFVKSMVALNNGSSIVQGALHFDTIMSELESYTALGIFARGVAHEGLNLIRELRELGGSRPAAAEETRALPEQLGSKDALFRLRRLEAYLTAFDVLAGRNPGGAVPEARGPVNLYEMIKAEADWVRDDIAPDLKVEIKVAEELRPSIHAEALQLAIILLMKNAAQAARRAAPPRIVVIAEAHHGYMSLSIDNNGPPFPPELLPYAKKLIRPVSVLAAMRAAEAGQQRESEKRRGVGLAIASQLLEALWAGQEVHDEDRRPMSPLEIESEGSLCGARYRLLLPLE